MLLVHQAEGFRDRGMSVSFSYSPTPWSPLGFTARVAPSRGGQATGGAQALWGRETMAGMADGGFAAGSRLDGEVGYGLAGRAPVRRHAAGRVHGLRVRPGLPARLRHDAARERLDALRARVRRPAAGGPGSSVSWTPALGQPGPPGGRWGFSKFLHGSAWVTAIGGTAGVFKGHLDWGAMTLDGAALIAIAAAVIAVDRHLRILRPGPVK